MKKSSSVEKAQLPTLVEEMKALFARAQSSFPDAPEEQKKYLQSFSLICSLGFDVYVKKQIIEKLLDELPEFQETNKKN